MFGELTLVNQESGHGRSSDKSTGGSRRVYIDQHSLESLVPTFLKAL